MSHAAAPERVPLMGLALDRLTHGETVALVLDELEAGRGGWLATANLDQLRLVNRSPELRDLLDAADIVVADGMPLVWATRLMGDPLPERVAGSDLLWSLSAAAAAAGRSIHLIGGAGAAGERAAAILRARNPGLRECRHLPLPMGYEPAASRQVESVRVAIEAAAPDIVLIGLGFPKQERLIAALHDHFPRAWFVGVGISFSFVAGEVRRAPAWMHALGLEWAHRLIQEPRRLARRYLVHGIPFGIRLLLHSVARRLRYMRRA